MSAVAWIIDIMAIIGLGFIVISVTLFGILVVIDMLKNGQYLLAMLLGGGLMFITALVAAAILREG